MTIRERYDKVRKTLFDKAYGFLNENQRLAVFHTQGPLLVLAGAGSGKTTVLVQRIAYLIQYGNAYFNQDVADSILIEPYVARLEEIAKENTPTDKVFSDALASFASTPSAPWQILSITFTNKAANEMKERLEKILGAKALDIWAGTFHSICARILRQHIEKLGLGFRSNFTIYDTDDQKRLMSAIMKDLQIDEKKIAVKSILGEIGSAKDKLMDPEDYAGTVKEQDFRRKMVAKAYEQYEIRKEKSNALDFDDLIFYTVRLLKSDKTVRESFTRRFQYILVDEYQDTNQAQFAFVSLMCNEKNNIMVVGDDDQSIYKFRGATIENILNFDRTFSDATVIRLEQNYRSNQNILSAANAVIEHNEGRKGKTLWTNNPEGDKIVVKRCLDQNAEAEFIVNTIGELTRSEEYDFGDFAVLYRTNAQANILETYFAKSGFPYRILGGIRFYERKEIKDMLAYLCLVHNPDDDIRFRRIINEPKRGIGQTTLDTLAQCAASEGISLLQCATLASSFPALSKSAPRLCAFAELIADLRKTANQERLPVLIEKTLEKTGYADMLLSGGEQERDRLDNIKELISNAIQYEEHNDDAGLAGFLEDIALVTDIDNYDASASAVILMTIHSAKGLEFPCVFLPGLEENVFPGMRSLDKPDDLEEERRLAYVAITRAKSRLFLTHCQSRLLYGSTSANRRSRFIDEIPEDLCEFEDFYLSRSYLKQPLTVHSESKRRAGPSAGFLPSLNGEHSAKAPRTPSHASAQKVPVYAVGEEVVHSVFGTGLILKATHMGGDMLYEIAFDKGGTKKIMGNFARMARKQDS